MKLTWCTDIHLDFLNLGQRESFINDLVCSSPDAFLITGDISNAWEIRSHLSDIACKLEQPIYYVFGNHDFWNGSFSKVHQIALDLEKEFPNLVWLGGKKFIELTSDTALVGHDCWYDALNGDPNRNTWAMPEWHLVRDFIDSGCTEVYARVPLHNMPKIIKFCRSLAEQGAAHIESGIENALKAGYKNIFIASHVPPFPESHVHNGKKGSDDAQPWFTSALLGDVLISASLKNPDIFFTSFSGHTHGKYSGRHGKNLLVNVGDAKHKNPKINAIIEV